MQSGARGGFFLVAGYEETEILTLTAPNAPAMTWFLGFFTIFANASQAGSRTAGMW